MGTYDKITEEIIAPLRRQVEEAARIGCTDVEIGRIIGYSECTVKRHFRDELDIGRDTMRASLRKAQLESAIIDKNPSMLVWMGKNYLKQRDPKHIHEHSGGVLVEKVMFVDKDKKDDKKD